MTCQALGGPCDLEHRAESAADVIKTQDRHLKEVVKAGDADHHGKAFCGRLSYRRDAVRSGGRRRSSGSPGTEGELG